MFQFERYVESFDALWAWMGQAPGSWRHPLRAPTCITVGAHGPRGRTMVLREVLDTHFVFFTDSRSPKMQDIATQPLGALHGYDGKRKFQIQLSGRFEHWTTHPKLQHWRENGLRRFEDYGQCVAPGTPLKHCIEPPQMALAEQYFSVLGFQPHAIELLKLSREGHRRVLWRRVEGEWTMTPLTP